METDAHILASLVCTKCAQLLKRGPVYQQHDGAAVCSPCQALEDAQPASRCLLYEATAALVRFPCRYREDGCPVTVPFVPATSTDFTHEDVCEYRQYECPVLGSNHCEWTGRRNQLSQHCQDEHSECILSNPSQITPDILSSQMTNYVIPAFKFLFLVHIRVCMSTAKLHYAVWLLGDPQEASNFSFTVTIRRGKDTITRFRDVLPLLALQEHSALNFSINSLLSVLDGLDGTSFSVEVMDREPQAESEQRQEAPTTQAEPEQGQGAFGTQAETEHLQRIEVTQTESEVGQGTHVIHLELEQLQGTLVTQAESEQRQGAHEIQAEPDLGQEAHGTQAEPKQIQEAHRTQAESKQIQEAHGTQAEPKQIQEAHGTQAESKQKQEAHGTQAEPKQIQEAHGTQAEPKQIQEAHGTQAEPKQIQEAHGTQAESKQKQEAYGTLSAPVSWLTLQRRQPEPEPVKCGKCRCCTPRLYRNCGHWLCRSCAPGTRKCDCGLQDIDVKMYIKHERWFCQRRKNCWLCHGTLQPDTPWQQHYTTCRKISILDTDSHFRPHVSQYTKNYYLLETAVGDVLCWIEKVHFPCVYPYDLRGAPPVSLRGAAGMRREHSDTHTRP